MFQPTITLKCISDISGFSVSTVSKALNNKSDISSKTREIIKTIAQKHNYVPNYTALSLRKQRTKTLAIIVPEIADAYYGCIVSEIQKFSFKNGYRLLVFQSFSSKLEEELCLKNINDGSVDAAIIISTNKKDNSSTYFNNQLPIDYIEICNLKTRKELKEEVILSFKKSLHRLIS
ncbi:LacI family transcriptional regulator [Lacinutrix sp. C3R15]|uniref:LacI family DNA-binding transcriptional regulator n=1 Tax=Flavobacteriaceae TaxID=49546 RepID=UPI001C082690|nr:MULTISPECIES: LacI family DNA-binding transcriptional regulator [Flavobacteriaceae]MBU2938234.1 LacI family transcriptional regulator [Lacinutrix sp. C3R15]MDO6621548.1 LacI family DNA-binding transcriptional regulator [Oceanihabitans sp. 1_MG-2023]